MTSINQLIIALMSPLSLLFAGGVLAQTVQIVSVPKGFKCKPIEVVAPGNDKQAIADVTAVRLALERAIKDSEDMRIKVADVCEKLSVLRVEVHRNDRTLDTAKAEQSSDSLGVVLIDLGDIEKIAGKFFFATFRGPKITTVHRSEKEQAQVAPFAQKVIDSYIIRILAHEIDHLREVSGEFHRDGAGKTRFETGKPVDDANLVIEELGLGVKRISYGFKDASENPFIDFKVTAKDIRGRLTTKVIVLDDGMWEAAIKLEDLSYGDLNKRQGKALVKQVFELTNKRRTDVSSREPGNFPADPGAVPKLILDDRLSIAAQNHSCNMAEDDFFAHAGQDGSSPSSRAVDAGWHGFRNFAENIGAGHATAEDAIKDWMLSMGHRLNMLGASYTHIGIGVYFIRDDSGVHTYGYYWTMTFSNK